ncbi:Anoctamin-5 [Talaromyces islandicus]|uniref:Anoctamin-5 n=1 Tax=Talaromyces islandicus TaxID=28573 RepID=A0A0U1LR69_TALIS|nr:Anoctamin-5 [Talaromyces islandicus]
MLQSSTILSSAVIAVGSLEAMRHGCCRAYPKLESPHYVAFKAYSNSISALHTALLDPDVTQRDDVIWVTFFLGLFELMVDPTGEGWTKHMLSGTCKLLQLAGPQQKMSFSRKIFFQLFRVLESSRAVLYGDSTILSHPDWLALQQTRPFTSADDWDSLGSILSLMIQISKFNLEFFGYAESMAKTDNSGSLIDHLGTQGVEIQDSLYQWLCKAKAQLDRGAVPSSGSHQAFAYGHALLIFQFNSQLIERYKYRWSTMKLTTKAILLAASFGQISAKPTACYSFPSSMVDFSSNFEQPPPPSLNPEFRTAFVQHKWNLNLSHIMSGYMYASPSQNLVRVDETYDGGLARSIFNYANVSNEGLVENILTSFTDNLTNPTVWTGYVESNYPLFTDDFLVKNEAVFGGLVKRDFLEGQVASWAIMYDNSIPVTVYVDACGVVVGYDYFSPGLRTRVTTDFFDTVVSPIKL